MPTLFNTRTTYSPITQFLHWVVFALVFIMIFLGYFMDDVPDKLLRGSVVNMHKLIGLSILTLMVLRVIWALCNTKPVIPHAKPWERWAAHLVHFLLYFVLLAMPIAGWVGSVAGGRPPQWGRKLLALPIEGSKDVAETAFSIHNTLAIVIIVLVSLHVLAALYHYFIRKDGVLQRMWG